MHSATVDFGRGQNTRLGWSDPTSLPREPCRSLQPNCGGGARRKRRCNPVMSTVLQFDVKRAARGSQLHPALKEFLDAVVIPALVKAYLMESSGENRVAIVTRNVPHSPSKESLSAEGVL